MEKFADRHPIPGDDEGFALVKLAHDLAAVVVKLTLGDISGHSTRVPVASACQAVGPYRRRERVHCGLRHVGLAQAVTTSWCVAKAVQHSGAAATIFIKHTRIDYGHGGDGLSNCAHAYGFLPRRYPVRWPPPGIPPQRGWHVALPGCVADPVTTRQTGSAGLPGAGPDIAIGETARSSRPIPLSSCCKCWQPAPRFRRTAGYLAYSALAGASAGAEQAVRRGMNATTTAPSVMR
jgi:hypothetical protein